MGAAVVAEIVENARSALGNLFAFRTFAVKNPHGVAVKTTAAGVAKPVLAAAEIRLQRLVVLFAAGGAADGVDFKDQVLNSKLVKNAADHGNHFGVRRGRSRAEQLRAELVEFAKAPRLGLFVAEAACKIADLHRQRARKHAVLNKGAHGAGGSLRPKSYGALALILKGVHFLLHDVGAVAHAAGKKLRVLKGRKANFFEAVKRSGLKGGFFNILPFSALLRKHILGAPGRFCNNCHKNTSCI